MNHTTSCNINNGKDGCTCPTPTQPDWREEALKLINEFGRMYYLVSEENWHESNESKARQDIIDFMATNRKEAVDTLRKRVIEELEKVKKWEEIQPGVIVSDNILNKALEEAQEKIKEL